MARGGKRTGSGRKAGAAFSKIDAAARKRAAESGLLPLDILLSEMRTEFEAHVCLVGGARSGKTFAIVRAIVIRASIPAAGMQSSA
jgi:hypothetical protein